MKKLIILIFYLFLLLFSSLFRYHRDIAENRGGKDEATTEIRQVIMPDQRVF